MSVSVSKLSKGFFRGEIGALAIELDIASSSFAQITPSTLMDGALAY